MVRQTAAGQASGRRRPEEQKREIEQLFRTPDNRERSRLAHLLGIDFVFLGPLEERTYPGVVQRMESGHDEFERVYDRDGVRIYRTPASTDAGDQGGRV